MINLTIDRGNTTAKIVLWEGTEPTYTSTLFNADNGTLIRDFVPCLSDTDGVGLFDLVESKFYGNAGTGSFIGSEVA